MYAARSLLAVRQTYAPRPSLPPFKTLLLLPPPAPDHITARRVQGEVLSSVLDGSIDSSDDEAASVREMRYMSRRVRHVTTHFPQAMSMDDFLMRVEVALGLHNFRGDNALALVNVSRDEATGILKSRIDAIFGATFNINGLGACITCGCLGAQPPRAPLCCTSHAP